MYLTDQEEYKHPFFQYNRIQSTASLITSLVFLMHAIFLMDLMLIPPSTNTIVSFDGLENISIVSDASSKMNFQADKYLQLYCFLVPLWQSIKKVNIPQNIWRFCFKKFTEWNYWLGTRELECE